MVTCLSVSNCYLILCYLFSTLSYFFYFLLISVVTMPIASKQQTYFRLSFLSLPNKSRKIRLLPAGYPVYWYNRGQKSWNTFAFMGRFTQVQPLPSPHKQCWTRVSRIFFRVSTLYKVGEGELQENLGCTVLRGNREMIEKYEYCSTVLRTFVQYCRYIGYFTIQVFLLSLSLTG